MTNKLCNRSDVRNTPASLTQAKPAVGARISPRHDAAISTHDLRGKERGAPGCNVPVLEVTQVTSAYSPLARTGHLVLKQLPKRLECRTIQLFWECCLLAREARQVTFLVGKTMFVQFHCKPEFGEKDYGFHSFHPEK